MLTFVINLHPEIKAWHLVEPFWYHLKNDQRIVLLEPHTSIDKLEDNLVSKIEAELEHQACSQWQLLFISDLHIDTGHRRLSLSEQLSRLQEKVIAPLANRTKSPTALWLIALDSEKGDISTRHSNLAWEIDCFGYLQECQSEEISDFFFLHNDFEELDIAWGWPIDFTQAGPQINNPGDDFLYMLHESKSKVVESLDMIFSRKAAVGQANAAVNRESDVIKVETLTTLKEEFEHILQEAIKPTALEKLGRLQPSEEIKKLLPKYLGLQHNSKGFRILRLESSFSSEEDLANIMVRCALLVSCIVSVDQNNEEWLRRLVETEVYQVDVRGFEPRLKEILETYAFCLKTASDRLRARVLHKQSVRVPALDQGDDYTASIALLGEQIPPVQSLAAVRNHSDLDFWKADCRSIGGYLQRRSQELGESVSKDINNIKIIQRQELKADKEIDDIEVYYQQLCHKQREQKKALNRFNPIDKEPVEEWNNYTGSIETRMGYLLNSRPTTKLMIWSMAAAIAFIFFPYILISPRLLELPDYWKSLPAFVILLFMTVGFALLSRWQILKPIHRLLDQIQQKAKSLSMQQAEMAERCKEYLQMMYRVFRVNKVTTVVCQLRDKLATENILLQYHLRQVNHHLDLADILMHRLGFPGLSATDYNKYAEKYSGIEQVIEQQIDSDIDAKYMNVYSPVICQMWLDPYIEEHKCQIEVCGVPEKIKILPWKAGELKVLLVKDQVFTV